MAGFFLVFFGTAYLFIFQKSFLSSGLPKSWQGAKNLQYATMEEWRNATEQDRLATAGRLFLPYFKKRMRLEAFTDAQVLTKLDEIGGGLQGEAESLSQCISMYANPKYSFSQPVHTVDQAAQKCSLRQ